LVKIPNPLLYIISEPNIVTSAEPLKILTPALPLLLCTEELNIDTALYKFSTNNPEPILSDRILSDILILCHFTKKNMRKFKIDNLSNQ